MFFIPYAVSTTCSSQLTDMIFLLRPLRYQPFSLWYKGVRQRKLASESCEKTVITLSPELLFQSATQSHFLTLNDSNNCLKCIFWHTPRTLQSIDTFKSRFLYWSLQIVQCQNITIEKGTNISHKTPAAWTLRK
jgi:hypothetical protein